MRKLTAIAMLGLLAACTPAEEQYCARMGTPPGSAEYGKCVGYFFQQTAYFRSDSDFCAMQADQVYPSALYDSGGYERVHGGYYGGQYHSAYTVSVPPDYYHNQMVDQLRMRVIAPCMADRGWLSPVTWEAGRAVARPNGPAPVSSQSLPWRK